MTLRRGESCGGGVRGTMVGHEKEDSVAARDSVLLVAVGERVAIGSRAAKRVRLRWRMGMVGKRKRSVDPRPPTAELFLRR